MVISSDCPLCGWSPPEDPYAKADVCLDAEHPDVQDSKDMYPKCCDYRDNSTWMGPQQNWKETHWCPECNHEFAFWNGT